MPGRHFIVLQLLNHAVSGHLSDHAHLGGQAPFNLRYTVKMTVTQDRHGGRCHAVSLSQVSHGTTRYQAGCDALVHLGVQLASNALVRLHDLLGLFLHC